MLETTPPRPGPFRWLASFYLRRVIPLLGRLIAGNNPDYQYLQQSTAAFLSAEQIAGLLRETGFSAVEFTCRMLGTVAVLRAVHGAEAPVRQPGQDCKSNVGTDVIIVETDCRHWWPLSSAGCSWGSRSGGQRRHGAAARSEISLAAYGGVVFPLRMIVEAPIIMLPLRLDRAHEGLVRLSPAAALHARARASA